MKLNVEQVGDHSRMSRDANEAFAAACRDPDIMKEDYEKLRAQYNDAMRRHHEAVGY